MISTRMSIWKMMRVELDCCEPDSMEFVVEMLDSLYKLVRNPLVGVPYTGGDWDPNRCLYVDARRQDIIDNFYHWVPYHMTPDTTQPRLVAFANYLSQFVNYPNDYVYVHIAGDADWADTARWGPYPMGLATVGPGFSVVFAETAYARFRREGDTLPEHLIAGVYKVVMHELGHQFMARDHCGTYGCIMDSVVTYYDADPHYCPECVIWARDSSRIQQFRR
jgi:predicted Zn-dependent protease